MSDQDEERLATVDVIDMADAVSQRESTRDMVARAIRRQLPRYEADEFGEFPRRNE